MFDFIKKHIVKLFMSLVFAFFLGLFTVNAGADDYAAWGGEINITLQNNFSNDMTNASVRMNLARDLELFDENDFAVEGADIRFLDADRNNLSSFVEHWKPKEKLAIVWFNATIPANSNITIYLKYGNPNAPPKNDALDFMVSWENFTSGDPPTGWINSTSGWGRAGFNEPEGFNGNYAAFVECWGLGIECDYGRFHPVLPPSTNYIYDFYFRTSSVVDNAYLYDGFGIMGWQDEPAGNTNQPLVTACNSIGREDSMNYSGANIWVRAVINRDRATDKYKVRFYENESLWGECNGTNSNYGTSQSRLSWSFTSGNNNYPTGRLKIDNYKMYKAFGWNTSDIHITSNSTDYIPSNITSINLTSECVTDCVGQIIYDSANGIDNRQTGTIAKTNDTTPTFSVRTDNESTCAIVNHNLDYNYSDAIDYDSTSECTTTGSYVHICTLPKAKEFTSQGFYNFSIGCKDEFGNEHLLSQSGKFLIESTLDYPSVTIFLDGSDESTKYELGMLQFDENGTYKSHMINITIEGNTYSCLDFDYLENWSCGVNDTILVNLSSVNLTTFANGTTELNVSSPTGNITLSIDNATALLKIGYKLKGFDQSGYPSEILIDETLDGNLDYILKGFLRDDIIEQNQFLSDSTLSNAINLTYTEAGIKLIYINMSSDFDVNNFTMKISVETELDEVNEFSSTEHFNGTDGAIGFNETLSHHYNAPLGVFDDFKTNVSGRWIPGGTTPYIINYDLALGTLTTNCNAAASSCNRNIMFDDAAVDLKSDSERVEIDLYYSASCWRARNRDCNSVAETYLYATDGTINIQLDNWGVSSCSNNEGQDDTSHSSSGVRNVTLIRTGSDYNSWLVYVNGSYITTANLGSLSSPVSIEAIASASASTHPPESGYCSSSSSIQLRQIDWSGGFLNRTNYGTYNSSGNITSKIVQITPENVNRIILTKSDYVPSGTSIDYYITNLCNETNPPFEQITPDVFHVFSTTGRHICRREALSSTINITSPIIHWVRLDVIRGSIENLKIDLGASGTTDWEIDRLNSSNSPQIVNGTVGSFSEYQSNNCEDTLTCLYPIAIEIESAGFLQILNLTATQKVTELTVSNLSALEDKNIFNFSFEFSDGILNIYDLVIDYLGDKNITLFAHTNESEDITQATNNITLRIIYSRFAVNMPFNIFSWDVAPTSFTSKNVEPFGQEQIFWNLSASDLNSENISIYARINDTLHSCVNYEMKHGTDPSNLNRSINMNTSRQFLSDMIPNSEYYMADFLNLSCTGTELIYLDVVNPFEAICSECAGHTPPSFNEFNENTTIFFDGGEAWTKDTNCPGDHPWTSCAVDGAFIQSLDSTSASPGTILSEDRIIGMWDVDAGEQVGTYLKINVDTTGYDKVWLDFFSNSGSSNDAGDTCWIHASTSDSSYTEIFDSEQEGWLDGIWYNKSIDITAYQSATTWIRVTGRPTFDRGNNEWCDWDNFTILGETYS